MECMWTSLVHLRTTSILIWCYTTVETYLKIFSVSKAYWSWSYPYWYSANCTATCSCSLFHLQTVQEQLLILTFGNFYNTNSFQLIVSSKLFFWASDLLLIAIISQSEQEAAVKREKNMPKTRGLGHMVTWREVSDVNAASIAASSLPGISASHLTLLKLSQALLRRDTRDYSPVNETSLSSIFSKMPGKPGEK